MLGICSVLMPAPEWGVRILRIGFLITAVVIVWRSSRSGRVGVICVLRSQIPVAHEEAMHTMHLMW